MTNPESKKPATPQSLDRALVLKDAERVLQAPSRRRFGKQAITLGGLSLLTGCQLTNDKSVDRFLTAVSRLNDGVQGWLFDPTKLAPTYPESMLTKPFPFNAFYDIDSTPEVDGESYRLEVSGLVQDKHAWSLQELNALPPSSQITRHVCVEGWSAIGHWGGTSFAGFLKRIGADTTAKYIGFKCADDYFESIDMASALHPQTLMTFTYDGQTLPPKYGYPMKLRVPTKLGYKSPKHIVAMFVTNTYPGGYWVDQGYNWFGGV